MNYPIKYNVTPVTKEYHVNDLENLFFDTLYSSLTPVQNNLINLRRMSNGTLDTYFGTYPVGKLKLQGRKHSMQILKGMYNVKIIEGSIDDFIPKINEWVKYINRL